MKQYDSYKDSGVEWIGEVPSHWEIVPFKRAITINNGCDYKHVQVEENGYPVIGSGGQFAWANQYMYDGEAVLLGRKGTIDKPMYYNGKFWTVDTMFYGISKKNAKCKYLYYQAKIIPFERYATATALPSMSQTDLNNNRICLPPIDDQSSIVTYLDKKCSEIDNVISAQQKRIALLQELKQSVITHAVTKGLNTNVEMKDSGVEWIGEIPSSWNIVRLKSDCSLKGRIGWNGLRSEEFEKESYAYLVTGQDFISSDIDWSKCYQINKVRYDEDPCIQLENGDLLITKDGTIGKIAKVSNMDKPACLNSGIFVLKQKSRDEFVQGYLYWSLYSDLLKDFNAYTSTGTTILHLYQNVFENMPLVVPSKKEQQEISDYLDKKTKSIDSSISKAQHQVDLLQEYKLSLITEVVTGKRKVC